MTRENSLGFCGVRFDSLPSEPVLEPGKLPFEDPEKPRIENRDGRGHPEYGVVCKLYDFWGYPDNMEEEDGFLDTPTRGVKLLEKLGLCDAGERENC